MPTVAPLRGLRYDPKHVGALSQVIAPPYDVIDAALQTKLYERHPANVIRIELNREEPGDTDTVNKYSRAAKFLRQWRDEGVVMQEPAAALYVYHQEFEVEGQKHVRRGVMARVRLERRLAGHGLVEQGLHLASRVWIKPEHLAEVRPAGASQQEPVLLGAAHRLRCHGDGRHTPLDWTKPDFYLAGFFRAGTDRFNASLGARTCVRCSGPCIFGFSRHHTSFFPIVIFAVAPQFGARWIDRWPDFPGISGGLGQWPCRR